MYTHTHVRHDTHIHMCATLPCTCVPWLPHTHTTAYTYAVVVATHHACARTHTFVRPYSFTCEPLLSHMQTQSVLLCITSHVYTHTHTHTYATWLFHMCAMTASHEYIFTHARSLRRYGSCVHTHRNKCATWLYHMCDMTAAYTHTHTLYISTQYVYA